jgi:pimeloyl-ACP methyl ester carboxylesterase
MSSHYVWFSLAGFVTAINHNPLSARLVGKSLVVLILGWALGLLGSPAVQAQGTTPEVRCDWSNQQYDDFYLPPDSGQRALENPGEIVRLEHIQSYTQEEVAEAARVESSNFGAEAYRILYLSQGPVGVTQTVSSVIIVPIGPVASTGFPVLVHGHPTVGIADACAPSKSTLTLSDLLSWVVKGYLVVGTDYAGLGTPGLHPYGIGDIAGLNLLDSARAAQNFCDQSRDIVLPAANKIILEGHSQGGQAALFAAELAASYAPELNLLGTVLFAPAAEFRFLAEQMAAARWSARVMPFSVALHSFSAYYGAPASLEGLLQPRYAGGLPTRVENQCAVGLANWMGYQPAAALTDDFRTSLRNSDWESLEPWATYVDQNEPGNYTSDDPLLVLQGNFDTIVPPDGTVRLAQRLCQNGVPVRVRRYANAGHITVVDQALDDAAAWINERLAGRPLTANCNTGLEENAPLARRSLEPVVVRASSLPQLQGEPVESLFVYAYQADGWVQIPFQVDEVLATGIISTTEDGLLDANDEIVFMAGDMGFRAPPDQGPEAILPVEPNWYVIEATDPTSPTAKGWVYVVQVALSAAVSPSNYVDYDPAKRQIIGQSYSLTFPLLRSGLDQIVLGDGTNILDRTKYRLECTGLTCPKKEDQWPAPGLKKLVKDGPVRAILNNGSILAYGNVLYWTEPISITAGAEGPIRFSTDFTPAASGATLYTHGVEDGVIVDGAPDVLPEPASPWWQLSTDTGTLIQVMDLGAAGGTPVNYYQDRDVFDTRDTGDKRSYGDVGVTVVNPNFAFTHRSTLFFLPDIQPNVGASYASFVTRPLAVNAEPGVEIKEHILLPMLRR